MRRSTAALLALAAVGCVEERRCRSEMAKAQEVVNGLNSKSTDSLKQSVSALDTAMEAC
jgi:PBP1b-binding outer membrane lipoprotein LpoB